MHMQSSMNVLELFSSNCLQQSEKNQLQYWAMSETLSEKVMNCLEATPSQLCVTQSETDMVQLELWLAKNFRVVPGWLRAFFAIPARLLSASNSRGYLSASPATNDGSVLINIGLETRPATAANTTTTSLNSALQKDYRSFYSFHKYFENLEKGGCGVEVKTYYILTDPKFIVCRDPGCHTSDNGSVSVEDTTKMLKVCGGF